MTSVDDGENGDDARTNFIEELYDKFLECRLCSRTYRHPKMLICQHTFCADCLEAHYEMDEQERPYRFLLSHNRDLSCPSCRCRTPLPTGGISRLPDNFLVANLTDVIRRRGPPVAAKSAGGGCEICRPVSIVWNDDRSGSVEDDSRQQRAAKVKCVDCDKLLCAECAELHRETKVTASHALFTIGDNHDVECKIHRNETLRFYCEPCEQCVCVLCALHEHKEHEVSSLADGLERHRGTFDTLLDDCKTRIDAVRQQLTLANTFQSSLNTAEDRVRHAAIDAIAAVRKREQELLDGLRSFVGNDVIRFLDERDALGLRLEELNSIRETTETMIGRTNVELLMTKKEVHQRLRTALGHQQIQTPDSVHLGGVHYVAGAKPFLSLHRPTSDAAKLFRSVADVRDNAAKNHVSDESSSSSSSSSDSESDSDDSDSEDEGHHPGTVRVVSELPQLEHIALVAARSDDESDSEEDSDDDDDSEEKEDTITKICISDGVVRRMVIKSQSLRDADDDKATTPPGPSGRKIPDFSRPKPVVSYVDRGTEMERVETTEAATATPRLVVCDKETYTGYVCLVHKNVSTDNLGTAEKGTSTSVDVAAVYRQVSNTSRSSTITRGTNTLKAITFDRACSPIAAPRTPTAPNNPSAAAPKVPAYPTTNQRPGAVQVPPTAQKSSTSDAVSVTTPQISPVASGRLPADTPRAPGATKVALRMPQVTSSTTLTTPAQPVGQTTTPLSTTLQRQPMPADSQKAPGMQQVTSPTTPAKPVPPTTPLSTTSQRQPTPADTPKAPGAANVALRMPQVTSPTTPTTLAQPVLATTPISTTAQRQPAPVVSSALQTAPSSGKLPPSSQKLVTLSSAVSASLHPIAATAPSQSVTSPPQVMTSPVVAVSTPSQQKQSPASPSSAASVSATAASLNVRINSPTVALASATTTSTMTSSISAQKPVTSSDGVLSIDSPSLSTHTASQPAPSSTSPPQSVISNRRLSISANKQIGSPTSAGAPTVVTSPLPPSMHQSQPSPGRSPSAMLPHQSSSDTAPAAQSVAVVSSSSQVTQVLNVGQQCSANTTLTSSVPQKTSQPQSTASAVVSVATAPTAHKLMTSSLSQSQPTSTTLPSNVTSSASVQSHPQTTSSRTQASNTVTSSMHVPATAQKPVTQPQRPTTLPTGVTTSPQILTSQAASDHSHISSVTTGMPLVSTTTRNSMPTTMLSPAQMSTSSTTAQKPVTSSVSPTTQPQWPMGTTTTTQMMTSQSATSSSHISTAATSMVPPVSNTARTATTATTTLYAAKMLESTTAQKPVMSLASSSAQPQLSTALTTTAQSASQPTASSSHVSTTTSVPQVSATAQKLMTSDNGQLEAMTSPSSTAVVESLTAAAMTHVVMTSDGLVPSMQMSAPRVASPTSRPRSVFRSISMDNLRAPTPVLRPPPPIMTTSVAAVTQRLNGGVANGSAKNGWRSNR